MPHCLNCESFVTTDFARVFGDQDDEVHACLECSSGSERTGDATAGFDPDERTGSGVVYGDPWGASL